MHSLVYTLCVYGEGVVAGEDVPGVKDLKDSSLTDSFLKGKELGLEFLKYILLKRRSKNFGFLLY